MESIEISKHETRRSKSHSKFDIDKNNILLHPDTLKIITQYTWNIYRVSHLSNLKISTVKLKDYAFRIKQKLAQHIKDTASNVSFKAHFEILPKADESDENSNTLQVEVFYKKDDCVSVLKYKAIIFLRGTLSENNLIQVPVFLCTGALNITKIVHDTLSMLFDAVFYQIRLTEDDLKWLSVILSDSSSNTKNPTFYFSLPNIQMSNTIEIELPAKLIGTLCKIVHTNQEEITRPEMEKFHDLLQTELQLRFGINFKLLKLSKILMSDAFISQDGRIKIFSSDAVDNLLRFISDISLLFLDDFSAFE